ncbi:hypothetical protein HWV62_13283 [Athelia sp. TMB]|nr:hypothetical protein HWV62_13283 [Athelia sp. TMB]
METPLPLTIASLANELLARIFALTTHDSHDPHDAILYPIIISHTCASWRRLAISTSDLWTSIILTHPSPWSQLSRTVAYLSRSRRRPLSLLLDFRDPAWDWSEDSHSFSWKHMENVIRLLSPHVLRWRSLELLTDTWSPIFTFLWYIRKVPSAPMLESLSLSRCNVYFAASEETFEPAALKEPIALFGGGMALRSLRRVVLAGVHCDWTNSGLRNLEELELKYHAMEVMPSLQQFVNILSDCPKLLRLAILGWGPRADTMPDKLTGREVSPLSVGKLCGSVCLPYLEHFILGFLDVEYATSLLSLFCLPALKTLTLEDISPTLDPADHQDASSILNFLADPSSTLFQPSSHSASCAHTRRICLQNIINLELCALQASQPAIRSILLKFLSLERLSVTHMGRDIFAALGQMSSPASSPSTTPALLDAVVDFNALLSFAKLPSEKKPLSTSYKISLDIRGDLVGPADLPRMDLMRAGVVIIQDNALSRRPSISQPISVPGLESAKTETSAMASTSEQHHVASGAHAGDWCAAPGSSLPPSTSNCDLNLSPSDPGAE